MTSPVLSWTGANDPTSSFGVTPDQQQQANFFSPSQVGKQPLKRSGLALLRDSAGGSGGSGLK
jgi:hypothetical protein